jgi:hypothetical protein
MPLLLSIMRVRILLQDPKVGLVKRPWKREIHKVILDNKLTQVKVAALRVSWFIIIAHMEKRR